MVKAGIEGEVVRAEILQERSDYYVAKVLKVITPSNQRVSPPCPHYNECGGCQYQHIQYETQVNIKQRILKDCLKRIAKADVELDKPIVGNQWQYRYRGNFKVKDGILGFYREGTREIVGIQRCLLMNDRINEGLRAIKDLVKDRFEGDITIIGSKELLIMLKMTKTRITIMDYNLETLKKKFNDNVHLFIHDDNKPLYDQRIDLGIDGMRYYVSPYSFFQANWQLNNVVLSTIKKVIDFKNKTVCDIYAGCGNFSLSVADMATIVYAFEENPFAIKDALYNTTSNQIQNCRFFCSKAEDIDIKESIDIAIINPPRLGMSSKALRNVLNLKPKTIIYLSCDPSTLSRDIQRMSLDYKICSARLVDFFPNTLHIETLVILERQ
ncbi:MAG: methyltransferase domain-containing protein [Thermodesulfovibrionales bacterium]|nr:methyltransferase domain-containing protein [Thermodesulfovibrionales bacterium]